MKTKSTLAVAIMALLGVVLYNSIYIVDERERAIVFRFGEIVKSNVGAGLHFKAPFINNVRYFDARVQTVDSSPERYLTAEKKNLIVDSFVKWRINDVFKYYTTLQGRLENARSRLSQQVNDKLRQQVGKRTLQEVVSGERAQIMDVVREEMNVEANQLGIEVLDVRLKRVDLDAAISEDVFERMRAERLEVARQLRAQGEKAAEEIRSEADRQVAVVLANANSQSEKIRGEGDAIATQTYANAFSQDEEFFKFYRSLNAYRNSFSSKSDLILLDPSSEFFQYFNQVQ